MIKTIIITPEDEKDFEFLSYLLKKLGYQTKLKFEGEETVKNITPGLSVRKEKILYTKDKEDAGLLKAMLEEKKEDYVSEDEINKALGKK